MATIQIFQSPAARHRLAAAAQFVASFTPSTELLLVGASREAVDDFARDLSGRQRATFGIHRFSLTELASRLAAMELARLGVVPATRLGAEAVAARGAFETLQRGSLRRLEALIACRGFARTLTDTVSDLRLGGIAPAALAQLGRPGQDLGELASSFDEQLTHARLADRAALLRAATLATGNASASFLAGWPVLLLDVTIDTLAEQEFVAALAAVSRQMLATIPAGDVRSQVALTGLADAELIAPLGPLNDDEPGDQLSRIRRYLFALDVPPADPQLPAPNAPTPKPQSVNFFSAPGEGRECVEIGRRVLDEARQGVLFDRMAIFLRAPVLYSGLLESALRRAGVPAWFARGTSLPDPSGRAFLALLACAAEGLSARRFAEYLSLGQVPDLDPAGAPPTNRATWVAPANDDDTLPVPVTRGQLSLFDLQATERDASRNAARAGADASDGGEDTDESPVLAGTLRAPWKWDRLLVESAVIGGHDRWVHRLNGLAREFGIKREECASDEPDSPRLQAIERDVRNLDHLRRFALPVIDTLAAFPSAALWGDWLLRLERLAPMVLGQPERVLGVLAELRPMAVVGPASLHEVREVLTDRLSLLQEDPPTRRYGRVFVGTPDLARGRVFDVVFVPGLAERIFPQKPRQDPLLLDTFRKVLNSAGVRSAEDRNGGSLGLPIQDDRASRERLLLRLAAGAAGERLYLSYPRMELGEARPRVPSFYALDVERAVTGRVPDFEDFEREASTEGEARLAWPAPSDPARAIDDTEHDLAFLLPLLHQRDPEAVKGRGRYLLELSAPLSRSLRTRWVRWSDPRWSRYDGLYKPGPALRHALDAHRLSARAYSVSALQKFAACPYQFLLSAIYRLEPRQEAVALEQLDPLTRGHMFHRVQAELMRELRRRQGLPVTPSTLSTALKALDATLDAVAEEYHDDLAPAIDRVWRDEVEAMRGDLRGWLHRVAEEEGAWEPIRAEFGFGIPAGGGRDPESVADPVTLDGRWKLHGVVDLVEQRRDADELRVTDHKTGGNWTKPGMVVGGGEVLQPVLYALAVEAALKRPVIESRLFYCTAKGSFAERVVPLKEEALNKARRRGMEVLEIVDRAVEQGILPPSPREGACRWCDFHEVCGPWEETRAKRKGQIADLAALRQIP